MPVEMKQGTRLTCTCCDAVFTIEKPCTCEQKQEMICACGTRLEVLNQDRSPDSGNPAR